MLVVSIVIIIIVIFFIIVIIIISIASPGIICFSLLRLQVQPQLRSRKYIGPTAGCTAVSAIVRGVELLVANAGDSRCVLSRNGQVSDWEALTYYTRGERRKVKGERRKEKGERRKDG